MSVQIQEGFSGSDVQVRKFLFSGSGYPEELRHSDKVILAVDEGTIVGGIVVRGDRLVFCKTNDPSLVPRLIRVAEGGS